MPTYSGATYFGELTFSIPYYTGNTGGTIKQYYDNDLEYKQGVTSTTTFSFIAIGSSRLSELKKYGSTGYTQTLEISTFSGVTFTGYTIDSLSYRDFETGYTQITGKTPNYFTASGTTIGNDSDYATEYVINKMLTRNEHFLGFIEQPRVYSDIFVERGKLGVMELNLRLGEIDNMGELDVYGNGYFKVKKQ